MLPIRRTFTLHALPSSFQQLHRWGCPICRLNLCVSVCRVLLLHLQQNLSVLVSAMGCNDSASFESSGRRPSFLVLSPRMPAEPETLTSRDEHAVEVEQVLQNPKPSIFRFLPPIIFVSAVYSLIAWAMDLSPRTSALTAVASVLPLVVLAKFSSPVRYYLRLTAFLIGTF